jgi:hypothetical protein
MTAVYEGEICVRCVESLENCTKSRSVERAAGECAVRWQGMQVNMCQMMLQTGLGGLEGAFRGQESRLNGRKWMEILFSASV